MAPSSGVQVSVEVCVFTGDGGSAGGQFAAHGVQTSHVHRLESKHSKILRDM